MGLVFTGAGVGLGLKKFSLPQIQTPLTLPHVKPGPSPAGSGMRWQVRLTADSLLFLLLHIDHGNVTSGKRLRRKCASAKHCGFLVHPSGSESRSQNQPCRVLVIWNSSCFSLLRKSLSQSFEDPPCHHYGLGKALAWFKVHLHDSKSIFIQPFEVCPGGWDSPLLKRKKKISESVSQFFLNDPFSRLIVSSRVSFRC